MDLILAHSEDGSILSVNDLPGGDGYDLQPDPAINTDLRAFGVTRRLSYCGDAYPYPFSTMRWRVCSLKNAITRFHVDSEGFLTFLKLLCGLKLWFLAIRRKGKSIGDVETFMSQQNDQTFLSDDWDIVVVPLLPGSIL